MACELINVPRDALELIKDYLFVSGVGGFGEIYLCSDNVGQPVGDDAPYALKIEPHENGYFVINKFMPTSKITNIEKHSGILCRKHRKHI